MHDQTSSTKIDALYKDEMIASQTSCDGPLAFTCFILLFRAVGKQRRKEKMKLENENVLL